MKKIRRVLAICIVIIMSFPVTVFAKGQSVTINDASITKTRAEVSGETDALAVMVQVRDNTGEILTMMSFPVVNGLFSGTLTGFSLEADAEAAIFVADYEGGPFEKKVLTVENDPVPPTPPSPLPSGDAGAGSGYASYIPAAVTLPYLAADKTISGWPMLFSTLMADEGNNAKDAFVINMNGTTRTDNMVLAAGVVKAKDITFLLSGKTSVTVPKTNLVIPIAMTQWVNTNGTGMEDDVFLDFMALTTTEASIRGLSNAGLKASDITNIGGNANVPVLRVLTSNTNVYPIPGQTISLSFTPSEYGMSLKPGDTAYIYFGDSVIGVVPYTSGIVGEDGTVTFDVPMVSAFWTIGDKLL